MPSLQRVSNIRREVDKPRTVVVALVVMGHVGLALVLRAAMSPDALLEQHGVPANVLTVEFLQTDPIEFIVARVSPAPQRAPPGPMAKRPAKPTINTTSAMFADDSLNVAESVAEPMRTSSADDVFDAPRVFKPFEQAPLSTSPLPKSVIRLPDRPSLMQTYWAVPEGENLQGRLARKVPLVGLLLRATGAIGQPYCPPKSEHPDCLQRLLDDADP